MSLEARATAPGWQAHLKLGFTQSGARTVLTDRSHSGPLRIQKPLYPEGEAICHAIIVHPHGGITRSDLLIINKTDLAPHVGANLDIMASDAKKQRGDRPFIFTNLRTGTGVAEVIAFIRKEGLLDEAR